MGGRGSNVIASLLIGNYIYKCTRNASPDLQVIGNGDVYSYLDWNKHKSDCSKLSSCMIARGALIKPWIFTEIKEQRHWDISSGERLNIFKDFVRFGLQHWGSDTKGVETTRHFLLEWLSYTFRYIPVGLLDSVKNSRRFKITVDYRLHTLSFSLSNLDKTNYNPSAFSKIKKVPHTRILLIQQLS